MVTLDYIAEKLKVSKSTVSRALSEKESRISDETKERIKKAAFDMGYYDRAIESVNMVKGTRTPNIGVSFVDLSNPFATSILKGVLDTCKLNDYNVIAMDANADDRFEEENVRNFQRLGVEGMIIHGTSLDSHKRIFELDNKVPKVFIGRKYKSGEANYVGVDTRKAIFKTTEYLIQLGHKKIVFLGASEKFYERVEGFKEALIQYNLPLMYEDIKVCGASRHSGYNAMLEVMNSDIPYTGIVCVNDVVALGAMEYIQSHGKNIPDDYSITGLDNLDITNHYGIALTTVGQPAYEIGKIATEMLLEKIRNHDLKNNGSRLLEYFFAIRKSCKEINGK